MPDLPSVAVIGAGSSGLAATKRLTDAGLPVTTYEKSDRVGGIWVYDNSNGLSAAYKTLHINTSRERMEYADFPMPKSYPDFPHHTHIAEYFQDYCDRFGLGRYIRFRTDVRHAARRDDGGWLLELADGSTAEHDALAVANGHHWDPRWPEPPFPGHFDGVQMHSHDFRDNSQWHDKSVLVLGMGNSAMDIAVEASWVARKTFLAARRGAWVVPKYLFGRPADQYQQPVTAHVPFKVRQKAMSRLLKLATGPMSRYGLPEPDHEFGAAHPTISDNILSRLAHGAIVPKPTIAELRGDRVRFTDGSEEQVDVIVYCTGYRVTFPFFDEDFICAPDNELPLFRRVFHPDVPNVFFIGLLQPIGAVMPLAEAQGGWVADYLCGRYALPSHDEMLADIDRERRAMRKRYVPSKRHTMQVDFDDYMLALRRERRRGAARARGRGYALPVPARKVAQPA